MNKHIREVGEASLEGNKLAIVGLLIIVPVSIAGYFWQRNVGSNMERELLLNSGKREAALVIQLADAVTQCEGQLKMLEVNEAELAKYNSETQTEAWAIANQNVLGVKQFVAECRGEVQSILNTSEIESAPEYTTGEPSLQTRVTNLLGE